MIAPTPTSSFWETAIRLLEEASDADTLTRTLLKIQRTALGTDPLWSAVHLEVAPGVHLTHPLTPGAPPTDSRTLSLPFSDGELEVRMPPDAPLPHPPDEPTRRVGLLVGIVLPKLRMLLPAEETCDLAIRSGPGDPAPPFQRLTGRSDAMRRVRERLSVLAQRPSDVLVLGETGTGKELAADALHRAWKRAGALVAVNCGTLEGDITQSRLFGHCRGAFTGAERSRPGAFREAHRGTLFLDEVNSLAPAVQAYLLRAIETRTVVPVGSDRGEPVDVRVISATNQPLRALVASGRFRADLLARIETISVLLPPLRARLDDIPELAARFLTRYAAEHRLPPLTLAPRAAALLVTHDWPGNIRELFAVLTRAALHCNEGRTIIASEAIQDALDPETEGAGPDPERPATDYQTQMRAFERGLLESALQASGWNVAQAARRLRMTRSRLRNRIHVHSLQPPDGESRLAGNAR